MRKVLFILGGGIAFLLFFFTIRDYVTEQFFPSELSKEFVDIVDFVEEIKFPFFYGRTFNPGIVKLPEGYVLSFRSNANGLLSWLKHYLMIERRIYLNFVLLEEDFSWKGKITSYHNEGQDARLIQKNDNFYAVYNKEVEENGRFVGRMHMAKGAIDNKSVILSEEKRLHFPQTELFAQKGLITFDREKNWSPFIYEDDLYFVYLINPHVIIKVDFSTGLCSFVSENGSIKFWEYNTPSGGTPALSLGKEYLAFFHASTLTENRWHKQLKRGGYYFGAYTFSTTHPFAILRRTQKPLYTKKLPWARRKIIYPTGFLEREEDVVLFAGVTDKKVCFFTINKKRLDSLLK